MEETLQLSEHRDRVRSALLKVMSRTERRGRISGGDPMLTSEKTDVDLQADDVRAYLGAREVAAAVNAPGVMEYWKSTPYLLSFMDRYRLAERLRSRIESEPEGAVAQIVRAPRVCKWTTEMSAIDDPLAVETAGCGRCSEISQIITCTTSYGSRRPCLSTL